MRTGADLMARVSEPTSLERAWIVGSVWCKFHTEQRPEASRLRALISARVADQERGLHDAQRGASPAPHVADVAAAQAALRGERLAEFLSESHLGGARWADLERAADEVARADVMNLLAGSLSEVHPALAKEVYSVAQSDIIQQLAAGWVVWTHPNIAPDYFATAALARHALFGVGRDDLFCVSMRIQGLI